MRGLAKIVTLLAPGITVITAIAVAVLVASTYGWGLIGVDLRQLDAQLTKWIPWCFGIAGLLSALVAYVRVKQAGRRVSELQRSIGATAAWDDVCAINEPEALLADFISSASRRHDRGLRPDLEGWLARQGGRLGSDALYSSLSSVLIIVGIVFTFIGVKLSVGELRRALESAAKSNVDPKILQTQVSAALSPLGEAFGANLVGIAFAIALVLVSVWLRHLRQDVLSDLKAIVYDGLEPLLEADLEATKASQETQWREETQQILQRQAELQERFFDRQFQDRSLVLADHARKSEEHLDNVSTTLRQLAEEISDKLSSRLGPLLVEQLSPTLAALAETMRGISSQTQGTASETAQAVAASIAQSMEASYARSVEQMEGVITHLSEWTDANRTSFQDMADSLERAAQEQQSSFRLAAEAFDRLREVLPELQTLVEELGKVATQTNALVHQSQSGAAQAVQQQKDAGAALLENAAVITATLNQLQNMPDQVRKALDQSAHHLQQLIERSDEEVRARLVAVDATVQRSADQQGEQAERGRVQMLAFAEQMREISRQVVQQAGEGASKAAEQTAARLEALQRQINDQMEQTGAGLQSTVETSLEDLQEGLGTIRDAFAEWAKGLNESFEPLNAELTAMTAAVQSLTREERQHLAGLLDRQQAAAGGMERAAVALNNSADSLAGTPAKVQKELAELTKTVGQALQNSGTSLTIGVDQKLATAVELIGRPIADLSRVAKEVQNAIGADSAGGSVQTRQASEKLLDTLARLSKAVELLNVRLETSAMAANTKATPERKAEVEVTRLSRTSSLPAKPDAKPGPSESP